MSKYLDTNLLNFGQKGLNQEKGEKNNQWMI